MADARHMIRAQSPLTVLTFPAEIDIANARRLCGQLGSALASASIVIADLTATTFCDSSGVRILLLAHEQAAATGIELRLVVPSASVLRTLALTGADTLLQIYPSLEDAVESGHRAASARHRPGQDRQAPPGTSPRASRPSPT